VYETIVNDEEEYEEGFVIGPSSILSVPPAVTELANPVTLMVPV